MAALEGSALIVHAGDVGDERILERLREIAPLHAVYGNTDGGELRRSLPASAVVDLGSVDGSIATGGDPRRGTPVGGRGPGIVGPLAYVLHGDREMDLDPAAAGIALVVSGHTHRVRVEREGGVLYLNPGSAGPQRFDVPATVARVWVEETGGLGVEIVDLGVDPES